MHRGPIVISWEKRPLLFSWCPFPPQKLSWQHHVQGKLSASTTSYFYPDYRLVSIHWYKFLTPCPQTHQLSWQARCCQISTLCSWCLVRYKYWKPGCFFASQLLWLLLPVVHYTFDHSTTGQIYNGSSIEHARRITSRCEGWPDKNEAAGLNSWPATVSGQGKEVVHWGNRYRQCCWKRWRCCSESCVRWNFVLFYQFSFGSSWGQDVYEGTTRWCYWDYAQHWALSWCRSSHTRVIKLCCFFLRDQINRWDVEGLPDGPNQWPRLMLSEYITNLASKIDFRGLHISTNRGLRTSHVDRKTMKF